MERRDRAYQAGRSVHWIKVRKPKYQAFDHVQEDTTSPKPGFALQRLAFNSAPLPRQVQLSTIQNIANIFAIRTPNLPIV